MDQARDPRKRSTRGRECEPPVPEPLAYFLTWPTYGTWLPGDERGWVEYRQGWQLPDPARKREAHTKSGKFARSCSTDCVDWAR